MSKVVNVLFLCTGNSARSIIAEGLLNKLGAGRFRAYSAGSFPKGEVHPMALTTLARFHCDTGGYRSKSWDEFVLLEAPSMDMIFTVCDNAAGESCPLWPGSPVTAHWGVPDPAAAAGSETEQQLVFMDVANMLKRRIELMLALPIERLDALTLQHELKNIGR